MVIDDNPAQSAVAVLATGLLVDHLSYSAAFILTGGVALLAAVVWLRSPETLPRKDDEPAQMPISVPTR